MPYRGTSMVYRFLTILKSFKAIYQLSPQQVDNFIKSYEIYDCDWVNGEATTKAGKVLSYDTVQKEIQDWYGVLNHLCAMGEVEKMYIPPVLDASQNVINNQILFEEHFGRLLDLKPGDQVLDIGCGRGRVAMHLASKFGIIPTGINIDQVQLSEARAFAQKCGLSKQCRFLEADFNSLPLPFATEQFDAIYEIQALSLSRDLEKLFHELNRILKPGGKISLLEWVRLPAYNPEDPYHIALMQRVKPLIGAIGTPSPEEYEKVLCTSGFKVLVSEDPSIHKSQLPLINQSGKHYDTFRPIINFLVKIHVFPKHFMTLLERFERDVEALCEADTLGLETMCYHLVGQKI